MRTTASQSSDITSSPATDRLWNSSVILSWSNKLEEVPNYWINKFRVDTRSLIFTCVNCDEHDEKIQERVTDQLQKINLVYRLVKTIVCEQNIYPDTEQVVFSRIKDATYSHFSHLCLVAQETYDNQDSNDFNKVNNNITNICDSVVSFMLLEARKDISVQKILTQDLIEEIFSSHVAGNCDKKNEAFWEQEKSWTPVFQTNLRFGREKARDIEDFYDECYENFFEEKVQNWEIIEKKARKRLDTIKLAYWLAKWKFEGINRRTWERYFEHLRDVAQILLDNSANPSFDDIIAAMLHDIVEDTNISLNTLKALFWEKIALTVSLVTKKSEYYFAEKSENAEVEETVKDNIAHSWILNNNLLLNDRIKSIFRNINKNKDEEEEINIGSTGFTSQEKNTLLANWIVETEITAIELFNGFKFEYKSEKKEEFFWKFTSGIEGLINHANNEARRLKYSLYKNNEKLTECCHSAVLIKLADTYHNLWTMWEDKSAFKIKKVREAVNYILKIWILTGWWLVLSICNNIDNIIWNIHNDTSLDLVDRWDFHRLLEEYKIFKKLAIAQDL